MYNPIRPIFDKPIRKPFKINHSINIQNITGRTFWIISDNKDNIKSEITGIIDIAKDKSANGFDLHNPIEVDPRSAPLFVKNGLGGRGVIGFDEYDSLARQSVQGSDLFSANECTIFIVKRHKQLSSDIPFSWNYSGVGSRIVIHAPWGDGIVYWDAPLLNGRISQGGHTRKTWWAIWRFEKNSNTKSSVYFNRKLLFDGTYVSSPINTALGAAIELSPLSASNPYLGYSAEVMVFNRILTRDEVFQIESYLSQNWFHEVI